MPQTLISSVILAQIIIYISSFIADDISLISCAKYGGWLTQTIAPTQIKLLRPSSIEPLKNIQIIVKMMCIKVCLKLPRKLELKWDCLAQLCRTQSKLRGTKPSRTCGMCPRLQKHSDWWVWITEEYIPLRKSCFTLFKGDFSGLFCTDSHSPRGIFLSY